MLGSRSAIGCSLFAAVLMLLLLVGATTAYSTASGQAVSDLLRGILASPVLITALLLLWGGDRLRDALADFLKRLRHAKGPGGLELSAAEQPPPDSAAGQAVDRAKVELTEEQRRNIEQEATRHFAALTQEMLAREGQQRAELVQQAVQFISQQQREAQYWRFEYLSLLLIARTQLVLAWFAGRPVPASKEAYAEHWRPFMPSEEQQEVTFQVLLNAGLIGQSQAGFTATELGRQFLQYVEWKFTQGYRPPGSSPQ